MYASFHQHIVEIQCTIDGDETMTTPETHNHDTAADTSESVIVVVDDLDPLTPHDTYGTGSYQQDGFPARIRSESLDEDDTVSDVISDPVSESSPTTSTAYTQEARIDPYTHRHLPVIIPATQLPKPTPVDRCRAILEGFLTMLTGTLHTLHVKNFLTTTKGVLVRLWENTTQQINSETLFMIYTTLICVTMCVIAIMMNSVETPLVRLFVCFMILVGCGFGLGLSFPSWYKRVNTTHAIHRT